jgi:hypothetical protein
MPHVQPHILLDRAEFPLEHQQGVFCRLQNNTSDPLGTQRVPLALKILNVLVREKPSISTSQRSLPTLVLQRNANFIY